MASAAKLSRTPDDEASSVMHVAAPIYRGHAIIGVLTVAKPNRTVQGFIDRAERKIMARRAAMEAKGKAAWKPAAPRPRKISAALRAYAAMTTSAAKGAVRDVSQIEN